MTENEGADKERAKELRETAPEEPSEVPIAETQKLFKSSSVSVREDASSVLATIATFDREEARGLIGDFVSMLEDESAEVRYHGAYSLSAVGEEYPQDVRNATDVLKRLLADSDDRVRAHAALALGTIAAEYPEDVRDVVEELRPFLNSSDTEVQAHAALVFANLAKEYPADVRTVVTELEPLLTNRSGYHHWSKRRASLALAHVAEEYPEDVLVAINSLEHLLEDNDQEVKENAETALRRLSGDSNSSSKVGSSLDRSTQLSSSDISREDFESIDPYDFEQLVADVWDAKGYDTTVRSKSGDEGIDVEAEKTGYKEVIQVKRYNISNKLGSKDIRFYATLYQQEPEANSVVIVTSGEFTDEGRVLADKLKVDTLNGDELISEIQEYNVELTSVFDQEQSNSTDSFDSKHNSSSSPQSFDHPFGYTHQGVRKSDLFGLTCPVCSSQDSIWATPSVNTGTRHKCSNCNTKWRQIKDARGWTVDSKESIEVWTAHDGPLHLQSGTPEEWMNGNYTHREHHPKVTTADEGCFIATAAFGTPHAEEIDELREFRDHILLSNTLGEMFVDAYYRFSPPVAEWISESERRKKTTRRLVIDPSLWFVKKIQ